MEREPYLRDPDCTIWNGDALDVLRKLPNESIHCCVTSPPYWGLRDYGEDGQIGLEPTPYEYVARMVEVFREVRRVLRPEGTCWLNLGDSYAGAPKGSYEGQDKSGLTSLKTQIHGSIQFDKVVNGLKPKDLVGIPWRVAFALQEDGWYLRSDVIEEIELYCPCGCGHVLEERIWRYSQDRELIWRKMNPMPESVTDRPTKAHEYVFLLTKSARYFYDADAIAEPAAWDRWGDQTIKKKMPGAGSWLRDKTKAELDATVRPRHRKQDDHESRRYAGSNDRWDASEENGTAPKSRNARSVWEIATQPYREAHFAVFPEELARRCIAAGCPADGIVLDPFLGSGTTAYVARRLGRKAVGIELNSDYCALAAKRLGQQSLLAQEDTA